MAHQRPIGSANEQDSGALRCETGAPCLSEEGQRKEDEGG